MRDAPATLLFYSTKMIIGAVRNIWKSLERYQAQPKQNSSVKSEVKSSMNSMFFHQVALQERVSVSSKLAPGPFIKNGKNYHSMNKATA